MFKKSVLHVSLAAALLCSCGLVVAASTPANIAVSATVSKTCAITSSSALAFGAYDPIGVNATVNKDATGQVSVSCAKGSASLTIGMSDGAQPSGSQRQMAMTGGLATDILQYNLFQPANNTPGTACIAGGGTIVWNATSVLALANAPSKAERVYNVCGTIPFGQDATAGVYSDTVIATLNF